MVLALVFWSAVVPYLFCAHTYICIRAYMCSYTEIDALNRKRQQLIQEFKHRQDEYLASQEAERERGRQERERKVEEKKLKEVEKKSRETLLTRCVHVRAYAYTYICMYVRMYILCVTIPSTSHYLTHFCSDLSHLGICTYVHVVCVTVFLCVLISVYIRI